MVVTIAVRFPAVVGFVEKRTVIDVGVAAVTVPTAPSFNTTLLFARTVLNPKPPMLILVALAARLAVLLVTTGVTVDICAAAPLLILLVLTTAVKLPAVVGFIENVTVRDVAVAVVTEPTAPSFRTTVLFPGVVSNPKPLIATVSELAARLDVLLVTTGVTVAT